MVPDMHMENDIGSLPTPIQKSTQIGCFKCNNEYIKLQENMGKMSRG